MYASLFVCLCLFCSFLCYIIFSKIWFSFVYLCLKCCDLDSVLYWPWQVATWTHISPGLLSLELFLIQGKTCDCKKGQRFTENISQRGRWWGKTVGWLVNKPAISSADIYSSVATPADDASEALLTARNDLFNKNSSMIHQSSFGLIYWFISFHFLPFDLTRTHLEIPP